MHLREALLQAAQHLAIPVERQLGMKSADDVELGDRFAPASACRLPHLVERHRVGLRIARFLAEGAQPAARHTNVRRIDVAIYVEEGDIAVQPFAHDVRHVAESQHVG